MDKEMQNTMIINIPSPVKGEVVPLESISDPAFSSKVMGEGAAVIPTGNKVFSPVNGIVDTLCETFHAVGLKSDDGVDVLIHVGQNTVELKGKHFKSYVKEGDKVNIGDPLLKINIKKIEKLGYDITTPVTIVNTEDYLEVVSVKSVSVEAGDDLIKVKKSDKQTGDR